jgi:hypothetical protein
MEHATTCILISVSCNRACIHMHSDICVMQWSIHPHAFWYLCHVIDHATTCILISVSCNGACIHMHSYICVMQWSMHPHAFWYLCHVIEHATTCILISMSCNGACKHKHSGEKVRISKYKWKFFHVSLCFPVLTVDCDCRLWRDLTASKYVYYKQQGWSNTPVVRHEYQ